MPTKSNTRGSFPGGLPGGLYAATPTGRRLATRSATDSSSGRLARSVTVGAHKYPTRGDDWADYRCELMVRLSRDRVLGPARRVNPVSS